MKYYLMISFFCLFQFARSQDFNFSIDHTTLIVNDLKATGDFYEKVLGLKEIDHPTKDPNFRWFSLNGNTQLHLIYKSDIVMKKHKSSHICLSTQKLNEVIDHLKSKNIDFEDWDGHKGQIRLRADGVQQVYIRDPEGYWIEINDAKH
ncbi:MAG: VOC family protein [Cellulophaga sp.]|nr:VOC family protein [Cellulophaga sp.]